MRPYLFPVIVLLSLLCCVDATDSPASAHLGAACGCPPVTLTGDPANPRSIVIENGIVRVTYPQLPNPDQKGAHMMDLLVGGVWKPVLTSWYGDWTFFAAPFSAPARAAHVLTATENVVEVAFEFDHALDYPGSSGGCYLGGCGLMARDYAGHAVYDRSSITPRYIRRVTLEKVIRVERCAAGYFTGYHTNPPLVTSWIEQSPTDSAAGEREHGLGWISSVTFASSGVVVLNPEAGAHRSLGILEQAVAPWWFATIPPTSAATPYVLFMAEEHPMPSYDFQYSPGHLGIPLVHKMNPQVGFDGRPKRYQTFLGAAPYVMVDRTLEPTAAAREAVTSRLPQAWPD